MDVLIVGTGFVGATTGVTFAELGHKVTCVDTDKKKIRSLNHGRLPFYEPDLKGFLGKHLKAGNLRFSTDTIRAIEKHKIIFICVGTPSDTDGSADLKYVKQVAEDIGRHMNGYKVVVNKSTVPVGTCGRVSKWITQSQKHKHSFDVVSNPEFLREGTALADSLCPNRIVIGSTSTTATRTLTDLYQTMDCPVIVTTPGTAELIKYASNSFLATKISFMNELARLCDVLGVNVQDVARGMGLDPRINAYFLNAGIGYGGSCLPKDVNALLSTALEYGVDLSILQSVDWVNRSQCHYFLNIIRQELQPLTTKTVAVLGLSFKPDTSDVRESQALTMVQELAKEHVSIQVHDPVTKMPNSLDTRFVKQCRSPEETVDEADAVILCTDWPEYREEVDWSLVRRKMRGNHVFDGRNFLNAEKMMSLGFNYRGVGYP